MPLPDLFRYGCQSVTRKRSEICKKGAILHTIKRFRRYSVVYEVLRGKIEMILWY